VPRSGKGTLYLIYELYHQTACRISTSFSRDFSCLRVSCTEVLLTMQRGDPRIVPSSALLVPEDGICDPSKHQEPHTKLHEVISQKS